MSCHNCNCLDCTRQRGIDRAMNRSNVTDEDLDDGWATPNVTDEDLDDGWATPIHRPTWRDAEVATERQAKAWGDCLDLLIQQYSPLNMAAAVQLMADYFHVRPENYERLTLQFQRFIHENPKYEIRKGKSGGVFRSSPTATHSQAVVADDYTCKGCGNTKLSTKTDKSCWKCGAIVCGAPF